MEAEVKLPPFLTSTLGESEWSSALPGRFTSRGILPFTHWIGDLVGPGTSLDAVEKRIISCSFRESDPNSVVVQPIVWFVYLLRYPGFYVCFVNSRNA
jgi:hypothetical protein